MCERWRPHPRSAPVLAARAAVARSNACGAVCSLSLAAAARLGPQARPSAGALALAGGVPLFPPTSPLFHRPRDVVRSMHFIIELAKIDDIVSPGPPTFTPYDTPVAPSLGCLAFSALHALCFVSAFGSIFCPLFGCFLCRVRPHVGYMLGLTLLTALLTPFTRYIGP